MPLGMYEYEYYLARERDHRTLALWNSLPPQQTLLHLIYRCTVAPLVFDCEAVLKNNERPPSENLCPQDLSPRVYQEEYVTCVMYVSIVLMLCDGGVTACTYSALQVSCLAGVVNEQLSMSLYKLIAFVSALESHCLFTLSSGQLFCKAL